MQTLIQTIDSTGLYATVAQDYLYDNAGTAAREPISALRAKQDALTFNYFSNKITGINNSAIGMPGALSGLAYSASPNAYFIPLDENLIYKTKEFDGITYTGIGINTNGTASNHTGTSGQYSFVIGKDTASINGGFAGGIGSSADGEGSFAFGNTSYASNGGHAIGNNVSANDQNVLVIGKYNFQQSDAYLIIGNGTNSTEGKSDILVVDDTGLTVNSDIKYSYNNNTSSLTSLTYTVNELYTNVNTSSTSWNNAYDAINTSSTAWNTIATNGLTGVSVDDTALTVTNNTVNIVLSGKVDKVTGKGLSTNDYETSAKNVVDNAALVIPTGANANNQLVSNSAMQAAIANVGHFVITGLNNQDEPDVQNPSTKIFYLTRPSTAAATDPYTEWIYTESDDPTPVTAWNVIGSTQIDLHGYAKLPSIYTEDHIIAFGSSDTVKDTGVTTAQIGGSISGITLNGGNELTIVDKVIDIPVATNTNNVGTDGIMAGADKVKLDNIPTNYSSDTYLSLSTANQTVTYGLNVTTGTYSNTDVITQIGGSGLSAFIADSANSAANSNKLNGQQASYYCTDANAKIYSNFAGGNGITVAGELTQTKSINSNLTEYQLQEGVGITFEVDDVNETVKFNAKPEIFLYYTSTPQMTYSTAIAFDSTNSASYHSKTGTVGISNTEITGLDTTKLYHCNAKLLVDNAGSTPETVLVKATNWNNTNSITYEYVNSSNSGTMELDWYIKGLTGCALTGGGSLSNDVQIGVKEIMITEVCYA